MGEHPPGSNDGPEVRAWLHEAGVDTPAPWCAAFLWAMVRLAGGKLELAAPAAVLSWVVTGEAFGWTRRRPWRGYVVAFSWHGPTPHPDDHMGIVERVLALPWPRNRWRYWLRTIEGNTGDAVRRRWRWVDPAAVRFLELPG